MKEKGALLHELISKTLCEKISCRTMFMVGYYCEKVNCVFVGVNTHTYAHINKHIHAAMCIDFSGRIHKREQ